MNDKQFLFFILYVNLFCNSSLVINYLYEDAYNTTSYYHTNELWNSVLIILTATTNGIYIALITMFHKGKLAIPLAKYTMLVDCILLFLLCFSTLAADVCSSFRNLNATVTNVCALLSAVLVFAIIVFVPFWLKCILAKVFTLLVKDLEEHPFQKLPTDENPA